jgi:3-hydroxybutyryl-CoA dehydratase
MTEYQWADLFVGLKHGFSAVFTEEMVKNFATLSGDVNPLHTDREHALHAGFIAPVVFGMMSSSLYSRLVGVYLPGKYALLQGIDIDFNSPCYVGEVLNVEGEIIFLSEAFKRLEVKASIRKDNRKLVSKAIIRVGFHG